MATHRLVILGLIAAFALVVAVDSWRKRYKARETATRLERVAAPDPAPSLDA